MQTALISNEWRRICVIKAFKTDMQKGVPKNSDFMQNCLPPEIRVSIFNF